MKKVYIISSYLTKDDLRDVVVTTSKEKAEKIAAIRDNGHNLSTIFVKDASEYDKILEGYDKFTRTWSVDIRPFEISVDLNSKYVLRSSNEIRVTYMCNCVCVDHIIAETKDEAIKIAKEKAKDYIKEMFRDWYASGYLNISLAPSESCDIEEGDKNE